MTSWQEIIGCERERELLDSVMNVLLERFIPQPTTFSWLTDRLDEFWMEGNLAEAHYTPDDLAGLSWRLNQLSSEQFEEMIETYRAI